VPPCQAMETFITLLGLLQKGAIYSHKVSTVLYYAVL
jgi:hypothetical protein